MFNEYGVINPEEVETLKYIDEFNQQVEKAIESGDKSFYIDQDFQKATLYEFVVKTLESDKYKSIFRNYKFDFHNEGYNYIYVTWGKLI